MFDGLRVSLANQYDYTIGTVPFMNVQISVTILLFFRYNRRQELDRVNLNSL